MISSLLSIWIFENVVMLFPLCNATFELFCLQQIHCKNSIKSPWFSLFWGVWEHPWDIQIFLKKLWLKNGHPILSGLKFTFGGEIHILREFSGPLCKEFPNQRIIFNNTLYTFIIYLYIYVHNWNLSIYSNFIRPWQIHILTWIGSNSTHHKKQKKFKLVLVWQFLTK